MALNFPSSPSNGDTFEGYIYNNTTGTWDYNETTPDSLTLSKIRLTSTTDVTTTSTEHALQIGPDNGLNLRIDGNEVSALNNGVGSALNLNVDGGTVTVGAFAETTLSVNGNLSVAGTDYSHSPAGVINMWAASTSPTGWLICNGAAVSRTTYAKLFSTIGTTYGSGDGSTTFNVPNLEGRIPVGVNTGDTDFNVLGETGGSKTHTHTPGTFSAAIGATASNTARIGYQAGNTVAGGPTNSTYGISGTSQANQAFNHYTPVHGVTAAGSSVQPYIALYYIIKT